MLLGLVSHKKESNSGSSFYNQIIIFSEFCSHSFHSSCCTQNAKSNQNVLALEQMIKIGSLLE